MLLLAIVDKYIFILLLLISCCCFTVWPQEWRTAMRIWTFQRRWSCLLFLASPYLLKRSPGEVRGHAATSRIGSDLPVKPHSQIYLLNWRNNNLSGCLSVHGTNPITAVITTTGGIRHSWRRSRCIQWGKNYSSDPAEVAENTEEAHQTVTTTTSLTLHQKRQRPLYACETREARW